MFTTAESITGGLISSYITNFPSVSTVFWGGFITYSNDSKNRLLGVSLSDIEKYGAVSKEIALQMAIGALKQSSVDYALSITGYAGPFSLGDRDPVGTVYIGLCDRYGRAHVEKKFFVGERNSVRNAARDAAIVLLRKFILEVE